MTLSEKEFLNSTSYELKKSVLLIELSPDRETREAITRSDLEMRYKTIEALQHNLNRAKKSLSRYRKYLDSLNLED